MKAFYIRRLNSLIKEAAIIQQRCIDWKIETQEDIEAVRGDLEKLRWNLDALMEGRE